ncbi:MAG: transglutaminase-like domain-containing protein [Candidatus Kapaibacterium sp.]
MNQVHNEELRPLLQLLDDTDTTVTTAVQARLISYGSAIVPVLRDVMARESDHVGGGEPTPTSINALACIRALQTEALAEAMNEAYEAGASGRDVDLERICIGISRFGCPETDATTMSQVLDDMALRVHALVVGTHPVNELTLLMCLNNVFFEEEMFRGATTNYYSPEHSYMAHVLRSKKGIPISLSLAYMLVADRVGIELHGIGMPLHFLVYHPVLNVYIDTFHQGTFLTREDCEKFVRQSGFSFQDAMLGTSSNVHIMQRLLRNLVYAHTKSKQEWEAGVLQEALDELVRSGKRDDGA